MTKQQKISDFTANKAVEALEAKLPALNERLRAVEAGLRKPEALMIQENINLSADLKREIEDINTAIANIKRAQKETVKVGGGCAG